MSWWTACSSSTISSSVCVLQTCNRFPGARPTKNLYWKETSFEGTSAKIDSRIAARRSTSEGCVITAMRRTRGVVLFCSWLGGTSQSGRGRVKSNASEGKSLYNGENWRIILPASVGRRMWATVQSTKVTRPKRMRVWRREHRGIAEARYIAQDKRGEGGRRQKKAVTSGHAMCGCRRSNTVYSVFIGHSLLAVPQYPG
jgi:hypothetical protein